MLCLATWWIFIDWWILIDKLNAKTYVKIFYRTDEPSVCTIPSSFAFAVSSICEWYSQCWDPVVDRWPTIKMTKKPFKKQRENSAWCGGEDKQSKGNIEEEKITNDSDKFGFFDEITRRNCGGKREGGGRGGST